MKSVSCDMYWPLLDIGKVLDLGWGGFNVRGGGLQETGEGITP